MHKSRCGQEVKLFFSFSDLFFQTNFLNVRMGKKCDLRDFDHGEWLLVPERVIWVFQKLLISWDFHAHSSLWCLHRMVWKTKKHPVSSSSAGKKHIVNERHQRRRARLVKADRKVTVTQITTHYRATVVYRTIYLNTQCIKPQSG